MLTALLLLAQSATPLDVEGVWYTLGEQSQVEITRTDDTVTGTIIWYLGHDENPVFDTMNPDESLRGQELLGLNIIEGFQEGRNKWRKGQIYDPTEGKVYRSAIFRIDENTLGVQGCVGPICQTQEWQLVPDGDVIRVERERLVRNSAAD